MLKAGMTKSEIENALQGVGDYMQIYHLKNLVKNTSINRDVKKFIFIRLAGLYEKQHMLNNVAEMYENLAINAISFTEKIQFYVKEAGIYIKNGEFDNADSAIRKALHEANTTEKQNVYSEIKYLYKEQAKEFEQELKRKHATRIYEKLLEMNLTDTEKREIKEKLLELYEKLGERQKYLYLKKGV